MLISRNRDKLINAVVFFASNTRNCSEVKLFKLLYLLDFAHFRETGRSVTGLEYRACKIGPVPYDLAQEWKQLEPDMTRAIDMISGDVVHSVRERVVPKVDFDDSSFTRRELRLMKQLAARFRERLTEPLTGFSCEERRPWDKVWDNGRGNSERIAYALALEEHDSNRHAILQAAREYEGI